MKIVKSNPPNIDLILVSDLKPPKDAFFCYGDTVYNPSGREILPDIEFHESIHTKQQGNDPDGEIERYSWRSSIDGELYDGPETEFNSTNLSTGIHTIFLKVMDNAGDWSAEVSVTVTVEEPPNDDEIEEEDEKFNWWLIVVVLLIILLIRYSYIPLAKHGHEAEEND